MDAVNPGSVVHTENQEKFEDAAMGEEVGEPLWADMNNRYWRWVAVPHASVSAVPP